MRLFRSAVVAALVFSCLPVAAQDLENVCHASSSYDLTIEPNAIVFDRADVAPRRIRLHDGAMDVDGAPVKLRPDDQDQIALFERQVRELLPRVRVVAQNGVDIAARTVRAEILRNAPDALNDGELDRRLQARVADIHGRIARSNSTHDWQSAAFDQYANDIAADLLPLVAGSMTDEAVNLAVSGDLQGAAALRDRAAALSDGLAGRVHQQLGQLRPQIQALCPDIRKLAELSDGLSDGRGHMLELVTVERR